MAFPLPESNPEALGLDPRPLERMCATIERHIAEGHHPGAQVAVARHGKLALFRSFGRARVAAQGAQGGEDLAQAGPAARLLEAAQRRGDHAIDIRVPARHVGAVGVGDPVDLDAGKGALQVSHQRLGEHHVAERGQLDDENTFHREQ